MYLAEMTMTELLDKPGLVQVTGICKKCGDIVHKTMSDGALRNILETLSFEGSQLHEHDRCFLQDGVCPQCQKQKLQTEDDVAKFSGRNANSVSDTEYV